MGTLDSNQIFTLIITAISIAGGLFLGLIIICGISIIKRNNSPQVNHSPVSQHNNPPERVNIERLKKELEFGTSITIFGIALAAGIYTVGLFGPIIPNISLGIAGLFLSIIFLLLGFPKFRNWIRNNPRYIPRIQFFMLGVIVVLIFIYLFTRN